MGIYCTKRTYAPSCFLYSALILALICVQAAAGQSPAPAFEVVSIKPNKSGDNSSGMNIHVGVRFSATNVTLKALILSAYDIRDFQLTGGPAWVDSARYDVEARPERSEEPKKDRSEQEIKAAMAQHQLMMQAMLADRFKLVVHKETKQSTVYALVVAKNGLKIKELPPDPPTSDPDAKGRERGSTNSSSDGAVSELNAKGIKLSSLAESLSSEVEHPIIDKTGLSGDYDFDLKWAPRDSKEEGPSIFSALQEQLGLKLEPQKGPVDMIVIDHVERASEN